MSRFCNNAALDQDAEYRKIIETEKKSITSYSTNINISETNFHRKWGKIKLLDKKITQQYIRYIKYKIIKLNANSCRQSLPLFQTFIEKQ